MPIMLVSSSEAGINIFPELIEKLSEQIADADFQHFFAPLNTDIPMQVKEVISSAELVFVFVPYERADFRQRVVLEKLIELELQGEVKIVKAFEECENPEGLSEEKKSALKSEMAEKWSKHIIKVLFEPDSFNPEPEAGSKEE